MTGWRLALRLAYRDARRARWRTALTLTLIGLPVAALVASAVLWQTSTPPLPEQLNRAIGTTAAALVTSAPDNVSTDIGNYQLAVDGGLNAIAPAGGNGRRDPAKVLATLHGRPVLPIRTAYATAVGPRSTFPATVVGLDASAPLASGLFRLTGGQWPHAGEVVVNAATIARGFGIGDQIEVSSVTGTVTRRISGVAESRSDRSMPTIVGPDAVSATTESPAWLVGGSDFTWPEVQKVAEAGGFAVSRAVVLDPPAVISRTFSTTTAVDQQTVTALIVVFAMALIELVLLTGPAFAVGARRQAHALALIGASGGTPGQVRRIVLASAVVLGAAASVGGVLVGLIAAPLLQPLVQQHQSTWFGPLRIPWRILAAVAAFGFSAAWLAAVVPAWTASRHDVVAVIGGRRGDGSPRLRTPAVGLIVFAAGVGAAMVGARSIGSAAGLEIAAAAIVCVIGMILTVPTIVAALAKVARPLPLPIRFAVRDAARHRTRTVPAVAAIAATMAGILAVLLVMASYDRRDAATYLPNGPLGQGQISLDGARDAATVTRIEQAVKQALPAARLSTVESINSLGPQIGILDHDGNPIQPSSSQGSSVTVTEELPAALKQWPGGALAASVLAAGGVVALADRADQIGARLVVFGPPRQYDVNGVRVATLVVPPGATAPTMLFASRAAMSRAGIKVIPAALLLSGADISQASQDRLNTTLAGVGSASFEAGFLPNLYVERGYQAGTTAAIPLILISLGLILMLGGTLTATALALADARPDFATLAAVGARPLSRRTIAGAYALAIGWVGVGLGCLVGLVPGIAAAYALASQNGVHYLAFPSGSIIALALGAPVATAVVVMLFARSRLPLVARAG